MADMNLAIFGLKFGLRGFALAVAAGAALLALAGCGGNNGDTIRASGTIEATEVNVAARSAGQVLELRKAEGDAVKSGDTLALIDHAALDLQLQQAQALLDQAQAQMDLLRKGARDEDQAQAQELANQAQANLEAARADRDRAAALFSSGSTTRKMKDDADARFAGAQAQYNAAQENVSKLGQFARPEELKGAEARVAQARAARDLLAKSVADCFIIAPVNGVVTSRPARVGELVGPGTTVMVVTDLDPVSLMIYVSETELARVKLGATAEVRIDAARSRVFSGKVTYISPVAEFTPKNVQTREDRVKLVFGVKLELPNDDAALKPGMPADAVLKAPRK
jgi:HlyD family secretion protein